MCLEPSVEAGQLSYTFIPEVETFGVSENFREVQFSLLAVRLPGAGEAGGEGGGGLEQEQEENPDEHAEEEEEAQVPTEMKRAIEVHRQTLQQQRLYSCPSALAQGFSGPQDAVPALTSTKSVLEDALAAATASSAAAAASSSSPPSPTDPDSDSSIYSSPFYSSFFSTFSASADVAERHFLPPIGALYGFEGGPSFWPCAAEKMAAWRPGRSERARRWGGKVWTVPSFLSQAESQYVKGKAEDWLAEGLKRSPAEIQTLRKTKPGRWVDDVIVPTGSDPLLDDLERRLEDELGLPKVHSDPWQILRYESGYRLWNHTDSHTDCHQPGYDPENDRYVTVLMWLSPCEEGRDCGPRSWSEGSSEEDGRTIFPEYKLAMRMPEGGLVTYASITPGPGGMCDPKSKHFPGALSKKHKHAKLLLQKWYYQRPVNPSAPAMPLAICNPSDPDEQCKLFVMVPGSGFSTVQALTADLDAKLTSADGVEDLRKLVVEELESSQAAIDREVIPSSHSRALFLVASLRSLSWQLGYEDGRAHVEAVGLLKESLKLCPVCIDVLTLLVQLLLDAYGAGDLAEFARQLCEASSNDEDCEAVAEQTRKEHAWEAFGLSLRMAALGMPSASSWARAALRALSPAQP